MIQSFFHDISLPLDDPGPGGWHPYQQFGEATPSLSFMGCHYSSLGKAHSPHPPHSHIEEELLVILSGEAELVIADDAADPGPRIEPVTTGQFVYYPAWQHHTIRNTSDSAIAYLMFKWTNSTAPANIPNVQMLQTAEFDVRDIMKEFIRSDHTP